MGFARAFVWFVKMCVMGVSGLIDVVPSPKLQLLLIAFIDLF